MTEDTAEFISGEAGHGKLLAEIAKLKEKNKNLVFLVTALQERHHSLNHPPVANGHCTFSTCVNTARVLKENE